jgi:hypothetical protein
VYTIFARKRFFVDGREDVWRNGVMFVRVTRNATGHQYLQIVKSYRDQGKVRQKVMVTLGRLDLLQSTGQLDALVKALSRYALEQNLVDLRKDMVIEDVYQLGAPHVVSRMMEKLGITRMLERLAAQHPRMKLPWVSILTGMIVSRFMDPCSKRRLSLEQWNHIYPDILKSEMPPLEGFYRSMDVLWQHKEDVETVLFDRFGERDLFNRELDVVFYDTTTLYFESTKQGDLRRFGYSKERRSDCTQVVLGLLIDSDGIPVGYELFPGNTGDSKSMPAILEKMQMKYQIRRIIFVADRGMITRNNLALLREARFEFILGMRLWTLPAEEQQRILEWRHFRRMNKEETLFIRDMDYDGDRLIISWSKDRAERDAQVRNDILQKIRFQLKKEPGPKQFVTHKGYKQFLRGLEEGKPELNLRAIAESEKRDGYFGILTNVSRDQMDGPQVYARYKDLWRIEDAFGEIKGPLETRPMFHWVDHRIQSHVLICLLAYFLESVITRDLRKEKADFTVGEWFRALNGVHAIPIDVRGTRAWMRNEIKGVALQGYSALHLKPPDRILKIEKIEEKPKGVVAQIFPEEVTSC